MQSSGWQTFETVSVHLILVIAHVNVQKDWVPASCQVRTSLLALHGSEDVLCSLGFTL